MILMRNRKIYGQSRINRCTFCDRQATAENRQGFPTCAEHKNRSVDEKRCACGKKLTIMKGKWGPFFLCPDCGAQSPKKVFSLEDGSGAGFKLNKSYREKNGKKEQKPEKKEEKIYTIDELEEMWDRE